MKQSIEFYRNMANKIKTAEEIKMLKCNDNTIYDIEFIKKYSRPKETLLDLGSGTGLIVNKLTNYFKNIIAVEFFEEFSKFIIRNNITIINKDLLNFKHENKFSIITMFGVSQFFNEKESLHIYKNVSSLLKPSGIFIMKNQFGINKTKTVTSSKEVGDNYYSQYREINYEVDRLKSIGFIDVEIVDIYPKEANRWNDTHYYALICKT